MTWLGSGGCIEALDSRGRAVPQGALCKGFKAAMPWILPPTVKRLGAYYSSFYDAIILDPNLPKLMHDVSGKFGRKIPRLR